MKLVPVASCAAAAGMAGAWLLGFLIPDRGQDRLILRIGLGVIFLAAVALFVWHRKNKAGAANTSKPSVPIKPGDEMELLLREAEAKLSAAKLAPGGGFSDYPVVFLLGAQGSTKTSSLLNSGLEPELLAGQVYQDGAVTPTRLTNVWFAAGTLFVEAGARFLNDPAAWSQLLDRLRAARIKPLIGSGRQTPRAILLCYDAESILQGGASEAILASARTLHERLRQVSEQLGISIPVYVLFTRIDRISYFHDYVRNFNNDEASQVFGVTLPILPARPQGVYGEEETNRLSDAFNGLFYSLAEKRQTVLARETDSSNGPSIYEFPREFRKLRTPLVNFLVELCRPSQLSIGPFLRGFYFSGVRPIAVQERAPAQVAKAPLERVFRASDPGATAMFHLGAQGGSSPAPVMAAAGSASTRRVPQWVFLTHLFHDVLLKDESALGASVSSVKTSSLRRWILAAAVVSCLILGTAFLISYLANRDLVATPLSAASGIPSGPVSADGTASPASLTRDSLTRDSLVKLDTLRQSIERLSGYEREGVPLHMRWGLYTGDALYPHIRTMYFDRFQTLLLGPLQKLFVNQLKGLPASPGPKDDYGRPYDTLKAYLMTTANHEKATKQFLSPLLLNRLSETQATESQIMDAQQAALVKKQFDFYSDELKNGNPLSSENDAQSIEHARRYLGQFAGVERVYNLMLADVNKNNPPINFNARFPGSAQVVLNNKDVPGAFTSSGFAAMLDDIKHNDRFFSGEEWVLGSQSSMSSVDRGALEQQLRTRFYSDYVKQWREYIARTSIVKYVSTADAASKLNLATGPESPLLAVFWLAAQNTGVEAPEISRAFISVHSVTPPASARYFGPANQDYMKALLTLQGSLEAVASQPGSPGEAAAAPVLANASNAHLVTKQMAQGFGLDPEAHLNATVQKLLEDPITNVEGLLRGLGPAELNLKGKGLCSQFQSVTSKYPFNPKAKSDSTLPEFNALFKPKDGALWTFYEANLQKLLIKESGRYNAVPNSPIHIAPAFLAFFNRAAALSDALYAGNSPDPHFTFSLKPAKSDGIQSIVLEINGQTLTYGGGPGVAKQFGWPATPGNVNAVFNTLSWSTHQGLWAAFRFFDDADEQTSGGTYSWVPRSGKDQQPIRSNGNPVTIRLDLDMGTSPAMFQKGYLADVSCVADIAK